LVEGRVRVVDDGHQAIDAAVNRARGGQPQPPHDGRANDVHGQPFAFDRGRGHHLVGHGFERNLARARQPDGGGLAFDHAMHPVRLGQMGRGRLRVEPQLGPVGPLPDPLGRTHEPHFAIYGSVCEP
jgi:hypothetical protein